VDALPVGILTCWQRWAAEESRNGQHGMANGQHGMAMGTGRFIGKSASGRLSARPMLRSRSNFGICSWRLTPPWPKYHLGRSHWRYAGGRH